MGFRGGPAIEGPNVITTLEYVFMPPGSGLLYWAILSGRLWSTKNPAKPGHAHLPRPGDSDAPSAPQAPADEITGHLPDRLDAAECQLGVHGLL